MGMFLVRTLYIFSLAFLFLSLRGVGDPATHIAFATFQLQLALKFILPSLIYCFSRVTHFIP
ncbi:hypothetical protein PILCRDRAFT_826974 [Piloderma croceum F 1598]|uniref:Uncharacterized protein n=1 Tax=Piloderma croceum (strain F 1598) TaxID=765440 RepID=A0A0C3F778_PILCF|nr:hypothetical protein PILCRDRAFT_826974 [Piloderma croceum F 1598]